MDNTSYENPMTEIALALAMAFFSIMVLTTVSMGVSEKNSAAGTMLAPARKGTVKAATIRAQINDIIVVYHGGRFYDRGLKPVNPLTINTSRRVLLALDPTLPLSEAISARAQINVGNLIVSTLDDHWMKTLRNMNHGQK